MKAETQQFIIAFYGALLSTGVFVWNVFRAVTDRAKLMVTGIYGVQIPGPSDEFITLITITNVGTKPIVFSNISAHGGVKPNIIMRILAKIFQFRNKTESVLVRPEFINRPQGDKLNPYEYASFKANPDMFTGTHKHFCVFDTSGKRHYMRRSDFRNMRGRILEEKIKKKDKRSILRNSSDVKS